MLNKAKRYEHKNWGIVVREPLLGGLRARAQIINKSDFIFRLARRGARLKRVGRGECNYLRGVKTGAQWFDDRYTLRANLPGIARGLFAGALLERLKELSELDFYIIDEPAFAFGFPHEADLLALTCSGAFRGISAEQAVLEVFRLALDGLAELDVIDGG